MIRPSDEMSPLILRLPNGDVREVPSGTPARDVVASIGPRLLRDAVAVEVDGAVQDLMTPLRAGGDFTVLTARDQRALDVLRHSAAHVLATAVRRLRPDAKIGFGPAIEDGFYYDFEVAEPFTPDDLAAFEAEMRKVAAEKLPFVREEVSRAEAEVRFVDDPLKLERLGELPDGEVISVYTDGPFVDLCRGPHVPDTSALKHFKLLHASAAYWRGDEKRQVLQRIYGTAFFKEDDLAVHLHRLEEAKRRDHRVLGQALDLFSTDARVGSGLILWHPRGATIRNEIETFERELILRHGYELVYTPHIVNERLFEISGHLENFKENMFGAMDVEGQRYRPKPMNCPGHITIYQSRQRSYRDLPIRYAEFGTVYRYERSGVLHGMLRVRGFTQDDAHVFCTPEQVQSEVGRLLDLVDEMLAVFGYPYTIELSTRPEHSLGTAEQWADAESTLEQVLRARGQDFTVDPGGGAFYGPKLDFKLIDAIGRKWQGPTVQLDFNLPERFELEYIGADNTAHRPVMLHRVLVGSMERFVGGLIEQYAGAFPVWLAPEQVRVIPISDENAEYCGRLVQRMQALGIRAKLDARSETLNYRIREGEMLKVPYMAVVGRREEDNNTIALRVRGAGKKQEFLEVDAFLERVRGEIASRALVPAVPAGEPPAAAAAAATATDAAAAV
ncbi:MAG TPA: threonine--tRNA ligase [Gemmatimonadaceae bacterium]|nr:threonine--tRNA ligase [Gemmatimonadaceae bacterium]